MGSEKKGKSSEFNPQNYEQIKSSYIHNWNVMDISFLIGFSKKINIDPTGCQNYGDSPGQIPKLILTLCHITESATMGYCGSGIISHEISNHYIL